MILLQGGNELILPSGKILTLLDLVKFCYDFSETDIAILFELVDKEPKSIEELSEKLNLSKATVSRTLAKLYSMGFISRIRKPGEEKVGRPRYLYVTTSQAVKQKMKKDLERCSELVRRFIEDALSTI